MDGTKPNCRSLRFQEGRKNLKSYFFFRLILTSFYSITLTIWNIQSSNAIAPILKIYRFKNDFSSACRGNECARLEKILVMSRGGGSDTLDDDDNEDDESIPYVKGEEKRGKKLIPSPGWSFLSALRMKEEAFTEIASEANTFDQSENEKSISKKRHIQQISHEDLKNKRSTIVGRAGAVISSLRTSTTSPQSETNTKFLMKSFNKTSEESDNKSIKDYSSEQNVEKDFFSANRGNVATAASRLIHDYIENESTGAYTEYYTSDKDEYDPYEYDVYEYDDNMISNYQNEKDRDPLRLSSKSSDIATLQSNQEKIIQLQQSEENGDHLNRKQSLERLVAEVEMKRNQERVPSSSSEKPAADAVFPSDLNEKTKNSNSMNNTEMGKLKQKKVPPPQAMITSSPILQKPKTNSSGMIVGKKQLTRSPMKTKSYETKYISSGHWNAIDRVASFGLSTNYSSLRLSRKLRGVRKATARVTGLHGILSGKAKEFASNDAADIRGEDLNEETLGIIRRRIVAIESAKERLSTRIASDEGFLKGTRRRKEASSESDIETQQQRGRRGLLRRALRIGRQQKIANIDTTTDIKDEDKKKESVREETVMTEDKATILAQEQEIQRQLRAIEVAEEIRRKARVREIDRLILERQNSIDEMQCEKDFLQRRPNPFFNYTSEDGENVTTARNFDFPSPALVEDYIEELKYTGRLKMLNHTSLWRSESGEIEEEDDSIVDYSFDSSYSKNTVLKRNQNTRKKNISHHEGRGGSWLLRQTLGKGVTLGEMLGETVETSAYQAVCSSVMSVLARSISALHGLHVMQHSDVRLYLNQPSDLPPLGGSYEGTNYAQETIQKAIQRGLKRNKESIDKSEAYKSNIEDSSFIQRDAVVETLLSQCQISAPLLKLFPLTWQRAMLANIVTLITAITSDFCAGMKFQILGYQLSLSFKPITEKDIIHHFNVHSKMNNRRKNIEEFEAAIIATAQDLSNQMTFLDRWHHRILGSGMLRSQVGNLVARIVLTLVDDVLRGATMDLWSAQAGGPRVFAGLEYRVNDMDEEI